MTIEHQGTPTAETANGSVREQVRSRVLMPLLQLCMCSFCSCAGRVRDVCMGMCAGSVPVGTCVYVWACYFVRVREPVRKRVRMYACMCECVYD